MTGDIFKEQIVARKQTNKDLAIRICLVVVVALVFLVTITILNALGIIITIAVGFGAFYLMSFLRVEYEYIFTNGELDIDAIYNRSRRKRVFSAYVKNFELMAHVEDMVHTGSFSSAQETRDYSSGDIKENTYAFLINTSGKRLKVIIEPNEKMMDAISKAIPRSKLHLRR